VVVATKHINLTEGEPRRLPLTIRGSMNREKFQIDTTTEIRERTKEVAKRRGMKLGAFVHRALAKEDEELARLIKEALGIEV